MKAICGEERSLTLDRNENTDAKERILNSAILLFSEKGYDATRVSEIASKAKVNQALIYYYFTNKENILDQLIQSLFSQITASTMDFIHANVVQMIQEKLLDIEPRCLRFINCEALTRFLTNTHSFHKQLLGSMLKHKHLIRILLAESLRHGKHRKELFRFVDLNRESEDNPLFTTIRDADEDFTYSADMILFKFFFSSLPFLSFVAYYDTYKELNRMSDEKIQTSFLHSCKVMVSSLISGNTILLLPMDLKV